jgi:multidrug efflux pump subunit AcrB
VEGVGDVIILGQRDYSMRVWLDPDKLQSRNLTVNDVIRILREQNVQVAAGVVVQRIFSDEFAGVERRCAREWKR